MFQRESVLCLSLSGSCGCDRVLGRVCFVFVGRLVVVLVVRRVCRLCVRFGLRVRLEIRGCLSDMRSMVRCRVGRVCFCRFRRWLCLCCGVWSLSF